MDSSLFKTDFYYPAKRAGRLLTIEEMSDYLGISRDSVEDCIDKGLIEAILYRNQKRTTIDKLEEFIIKLFTKEISHDIITRFEPQQQQRQRERIKRRMANSRDVA